ncbi:DUF4222 domain-containing protein [Candidatus Pantoea multigeneris]|uniref:DUF4222 domain-containing protein n=1 Tax=Candidatus Pantoea multigeneris TaxID=2608357 RepID=A0ABX0R4E8_9GAMM|nr:DUF4222 domain-containing protein [Pantoea multigeneris]NIF20285.1 DUF4222 domain-containing protein [Pantoea multigeneris]
MDERFVETNQTYSDRRGIRVCVTRYDRQNRQIIFMRPGYPHECMVPKWYFEKYFKKAGKEG